MENFEIPSLVIGNDSYQAIAAICTRFGTTAALLGSPQGLSAAERSIRESCLWKIAFTGSFSIDRETASTLCEKREILAADMLFAAGGEDVMSLSLKISRVLKKPVFAFITDPSALPLLFAGCAGPSTAETLEKAAHPVQCFLRPDLMPDLTLPLLKSRLLELFHAQLAAVTEALSR